MIAVPESSPDILIGWFAYRNRLADPCYIDKVLPVNIFCSGIPPPCAAAKGNCTGHTIKKNCRRLPVPAADES